MYSAGHSCGWHIAVFSTQYPSTLTCLLHVGLSLKIVGQWRMLQRVHNNEEVEVTICESLEMQKPYFCCDILLHVLPSWVVASVFGNCVDKYGVSCIQHCSDILFHFLGIKAIPLTGLDKPLRFQEVEAPRFQDSRHMKVAGLSALHAGRLYPIGYIPGTHFC